MVDVVGWLISRPGIHRGPPRPRILIFRIGRHDFLPEPQTDTRRTVLYWLLRLYKFHTAHNAKS